MTDRPRQVVLVCLLILTAVESQMVSLFPSQIPYRVTGRDVAARRMAPHHSGGSGCDTCG